MNALAHYLHNGSSVIDRTTFFDGIDTNYCFEVRRLRATAYGVNAVYMFCAERAGKYVPLYIGKASILSNRQDGHERLNEAEQLGAVALLTHVPSTGDPVDFETAEKRLIRFYNPMMNTQHRTLVNALSRGFR